LSTGRERTGGGRARAGDVVNLCFHGVGAPQRTLEPDEAQYWIDGDRFVELLSVIARHPSVRISFDDGNASDATIALPLLLRHNLTASFFVVAGRLDQPGSLSSAQVKELTRRGMTVGSHGMLHRPWRSLDDHELRKELCDSARIISDVADQTVREVACPFGAYDRRVLSAARRHGFARAYTVDGVPARTESWLQSRYTIRNDDAPASIERLVRSPRGTAVASATRAAKTLIKRMR
jgi:peptidoglycan/xylan/chitin deacetylase (PgdA/CDA1 family)